MGGKYGKKLQKQVIFDKTTCFCWSEMGDSNSRHLAPKASALPTALHPDTVFTLHRKSVFDSPNSILDFGRKVNRPVAYPARIAYNKNIPQYIKERAL